MPLGASMGIIDFMKTQMALPKLELRVGPYTLRNGAILILKERFFVVSHGRCRRIVLRVSCHKIQ